jgi:phosphoglycolate phosphatase
MILPYDIYLFDLDGTLSDPKPGITKSFQYALAAFGIHEETDNLTKFIGPPLRETIKGHFGFSDSDTEAAVVKYREYFAETGLYENTVYPGIPETLRFLKDGGASMAVATSKVTVYTIEILRYLELDAFFSFVSGDEMDGSLTRNGKRDVIRIALDYLDPERKKRAVMIGDRSHDIVGALENGIDGVGAAWGYGSPGELEAAGAKIILDSPAALRRYLANA